MIPVEKAHYPVSAVTDPGKSGKNNEDNFAISAYVLDDSDPTPSLVAVVADGVGGHQAGEVASSIAVEMISQLIAESDATHPLATLEGAFHRANQAIYSQATIDPSNAGMSTTAACAWIIGDQLYTASMGDSRIYLKRGDRITQLTVDHTWVQEAIESGLLTREQVRSHPNAHLIRRYLGSKQPAIPDFRMHLSPADQGGNTAANQGLVLEAGDYLLLCTDGLTDLVTDDEILSSIETFSGDEGIHQLIQLANSRGGHDNITIIGIQVPDDKLVIAAPKRRNRLFSALVIISVVILIALGAWFYTMYFQDEGGDSGTFPTGTVGISAPTITETEISTTLPPPTEEFTPEVSPSPPLTDMPGEDTPVPATYTPWPTSTTSP
jgi:protein phosphatase